MPKREQNSVRSLQTVQQMAEIYQCQAKTDFPITIDVEII